MTTRAMLGMSHTPLMGLNPLGSAIEAELQSAIGEIRSKVLAFAPELVVLIAPDHYNGFFNEVMPPFCIGSEARSVGDYLSPAGDLNVDGQTALGLATWLMDHDFDPAVSRSMVVDHGFAQSLQLMWGGLDTPPVLPIFLNAVAQPGIARMRRCRALGQSIGAFLKDDSRRILFLGSGGLSHEPPVPTMSHPDAGVRERITHRKEATPAERDAKTQRVMAAGMALAAGSSTIKPLNPAWDRRWIDAMTGGAADLDRLCEMHEEEIEREGGLSAHESKTWLIGRSALGDDQPLHCGFRHYQAIPEYIAGYGLLWLTTAA